MSDTLLVRAAASADFAAIDALLARAYPALLKRDYPPSTLILAVPLIARANPRLIASGTYYVVERDGAIVGAGGWTRSAPAGGVGRRGPAIGNIRHFVTDHRMTRQGIGRTLMDFITRDARAAAVRTLECLSTRTARPFYAACGFVALGEVSVALAPGVDFPAIRMRRRI